MAYCTPDNTSKASSAAGSETSSQPLTGPDDPRVVAFLAAWHENGRDEFARSYANLDYDRDYAKAAHAKQKYICLDCGTSGSMMVERATGQVFGIKGYGRIHRGHPCGHIEDVTRSYQEATAENRRLRPAANVYL